MCTFYHNIAICNCIKPYGRKLSIKSVLFGCVNTDCVQSKQLLIKDNSSDLKSEKGDNSIFEEPTWFGSKT